MRQWSWRAVHHKQTNRNLLLSASKKRIFGDPDMASKLNTARTEAENLGISVVGAPETVGNVVKEPPTDALY